MKRLLLFFIIISSLFISCDESDYDEPRRLFEYKVVETYHSELSKQDSVFLFDAYKKIGVDTTTMTVLASNKRKFEVSEKYFENIKGEMDIDFIKSGKIEYTITTPINK